MKEFIAGKNEAGQRLDKLLCKYLPNAPKSFIYKMLRKKNFTVNGKKAAGSEIVQKQDVIRLYLSDETYEKFSVPANRTPEIKQYPADRQYPITKQYPVTSLDIIYESKDYIVINKPAGMLSQKAGKEDISANEYLIGYMLEQEQITPEELQVFHPSVCNRLDRNTSGLLIFGKTLHGLQTMAESLKTRTFGKYYWCLAEGRIEKPQKISGYLKKDKKSNQVTVTAGKRKGGKNEAEGSYIETEYVPLKNYRHYTLLEVHLITGKPHQIRAHLSEQGHPLAGDRKYGGSADILTKKGNVRLSGQFLHAKRLEFADGTVLEAPLPERLEEILNMLEEMPIRENLKKM
ncbi:MAG: RluA family pseudouridine synthase [Eubacterium sp.]|nr:RluA family pseudouridine synthase [Eubacterium sp.]